MLLPVKILSILLLSGLSAFGQASLKLQTIEASEHLVTNQIGLTEWAGQTNTLALTATDAARIHTIQIWDGDSDPYDFVWFIRNGYKVSVTKGEIITGPGLLVVAAHPDSNWHSVVVLERIKVIKIKGSPY